MSKNQKDQKKEENVIELKNLNVLYNKGMPNQVRALENINVEFKPREWVIVFGPSGCGKSTLLNSIASLDTPTSGKVVVNGKDINKFNSNEKAEYRQKRIGMIFQSFHLINSLRVLQNVCLPQVFLRADLEKRKEIAMRHLKRFNIEDQADKFPSQISGGQKQKVSIARALMNDPEIILADEPDGSLDSKSAYNVMTILKELNEIDKKTIVMVTHNRDRLSYADRIIHMKDGKIVKVEIVRKKKADTKDKDKKTVKTEQKVPMDLKLLMNSFRDLSFSQLSNLLEPFKVKQVFSYLMLPITNHQVEITKKKMNQFFLGNIKKEELKKELDKSIDEGGAGWDKRNAENFVEELNELLTHAKKIDYSMPLKSAIEMAEYLRDKYSLETSEFEFNLVKNSISERFKNEISIDKLKEILDKPQGNGGAGLDKRTAEKVAREIEIMILIRYSE